MYGKEELLNINGGTLNGTIINALVRAYTFILEVGKSFGSAIRRVGNGTRCGS